MKQGLLYCPKENNAIANTTIWFLEKDHWVNHVPRNKLVLQELNKQITNKSIIN